MLRAPGARVTGVDIEASAIEASPGPLNPGEVTARIELTGLSGNM
jgi:hypothetical protein